MDAGLDDRDVEGVGDLDRVVVEELLAPGVVGHAAAVSLGVERFGCRATESFEFFRSEFGSNSVSNQGDLSESLRNSEMLGVLIELLNMF